MKPFTKKPLWAVLILLFTFTTGTLAQTRKKVACIGNSITENYNLPTSQKYPTLLQNNIGTDNFEVRNYGVSGRTMLRNGNYPYWNETKYQEVLNWNPDIVIIKLGTNDGKPQNWQYKDEFEQDYTDFVNSFKNLSGNPEIYVCYPLPAFAGNSLPVNDATITDEMIPIITRVAENTGSTVIDLHAPFEGKEYLTTDKIHPNFQGTTYMAYLIAKVLCPECTIPELPEDMFLRVSSFDYTDKSNELTSSVVADLNTLIDNDALTGISIPFARNMWFKTELTEPLKLTGYALTPVKDSGTDAPKSWRIQGCNNGVSWEEIDTQTGMEFNEFETKVIETPFTSLNDVKSYKYYRLLVQETNGGENLQLSEWQLFGFPETIKSGVTQNGGAISAQHSGYSGEGVENLIDRRMDKKYCAVDKKTGWIQYDSPVKVIVDKYSITSCYNLFGRNLRSWELQGSNDGNQWSVLDSRTEQDFMVKYNMVEYEVENPGAYTKYRLNITANNGDGTFQFAEWQLFGEDVPTSTKMVTNNNVYSRDGKVYVTVANTVDFQLYDIMGRIISKGVLFEGENEISMDNSGVVFICLLNNTGNTVLKLII